MFFFSYLLTVFSLCLLWPSRNQYSLAFLAFQMSYKIKYTLISSYYILSLLLRKELLIDWKKTKEIYQSSLNIYNKAWLNANLAKTPILITVEFKELLEIFMGIFYLHLPSYSSLAKTWLLYDTRFMSGLSFPHPTLSMVQCFFGFLSESIGCKQKSLHFEGHTWNRGKKMICKQKSQVRLASGTGKPGLSHKRVYPLQSHQDSHQ